MILGVWALSATGSNGGYPHGVASAQRQGARYSNWRYTCSPPRRPASWERTEPGWLANKPGVCVRSWGCPRNGYCTGPGSNLDPDRLPHIRSLHLSLTHSILIPPSPPSRALPIGDSGSLARSAGSLPHRTRRRSRSDNARNATPQCLLLKTRPLQLLPFLATCSGCYFWNRAGVHTTCIGFIPVCLP